MAKESANQGKAPMEKPQWEKKWSIFCGSLIDGYAKEDAETIQLNEYFLARIDQYRLQQKLQELGFVSMPYSHRYMAYFIDDKKRKHDTMCIVGIGEDESPHYTNTFNTLKIIINYCAKDALAIGVVPLMSRLSVSSQTS